jgi:hypothetical protein
LGDEDYGVTALTMLTGGGRGQDGQDVFIPGPVALKSGGSGYGLAETGNPRQQSARDLNGLIWPPEGGSGLSPNNADGRDAKPLPDRRHGFEP